MNGKSTSGVQPLDQDYIVPATMLDPELTYYADGTRLIIRPFKAPNTFWDGRTGIAVGFKPGHPYAFQAVQWDHGGRDNVVPHILQREEAGADFAPETR